MPNMGGVTLKTSNPFKFYYASHYISKRQTKLKLVTQSHGSSLPPRRSFATKDPKIAGLPKQ